MTTKFFIHGKGRGGVGGGVVPACLCFLVLEVKQFSLHLSALKLNYLAIKGGNYYPHGPQLPLRWAY